MVPMMTHLRLVLDVSNIPIILTVVIQVMVILIIMITGIGKRQNILPQQNKAVVLFVGIDWTEETAEFESIEQWNYVPRHI